MKGKLRFLSAILVAAICLGTLSGCGDKKEETNAPATTAAKKGPDYLNEKGLPIVNKPITLKFMVGKHVTQGEYGEILTWKEYEKLSGIKIEWEQIPQTSIAEKRNLALASGEYPDGFYRCGISDKDLIKYGDEGVFLKLNDYIDNYAPNLKGVMGSMADVKKGITNYNGAIYGFPALSDSEPMEINLKPYINQTWLNKLNLKMPTTTDELYNVLKEFKEKDPNGNSKLDEIPLASTKLDYIQDALYGAWGLRNRGLTHSRVDWDDKASKLRFIPTSTQYKEMITYLNKLYKEGLLYQEIFTSNNTKLLALGEQNLVGLFTFTNLTVIGTKYEKDYQGLTSALKGPNGDQLYTAKRARVSGKGALVLTKANKYPEAATRWIDYFYGEDGSKLFFLGVEGQTYRKTSNGDYEFIPELIKIPEGSNYDQVVGKYSPFAGGGNPVLILTKYFKGGETQPIPLKASQDLGKYTPKEIWGQFSYTLEENDRLVSLENDITSYINQMIPQFIQGKAPLSQWDSYVEQVKKMGLDEYMKIYTAAYERYKKN